MKAFFVIRAQTTFKLLLINESRGTVELLLDYRKEICVLDRIHGSAYFSDHSKVLVKHMTFARKFEAFYYTSDVKKLS